MQGGDLGEARLGQLIIRFAQPVDAPLVSRVRFEHLLCLPTRRLIAAQPELGLGQLDPLLQAQGLLRPEADSQPLVTSLREPEPRRAYSFRRRVRISEPRFPELARGRLEEAWR